MLVILPLKKNIKEIFLDVSLIRKQEMVMTYDPDIEPMMKRHFLGEMIRDAQANYMISHGNYPNNLYLGRDEYNIWTKGYPELFGHDTPDDNTGYRREYAVAYGMLVYVKAKYTDVKKLNSDEFYQHTVKSHLEVALCTDDTSRGVHRQVLSTVGFKVKHDQT